MDRLDIKAALDVTEEGVVAGIAWPFGSPDRVGDVIEKGAFTAASRLPMLFAHDQAQTVGVWDSIGEAEDGLRVKGKLLIEDVARAREVRAIIRAGAATGLSIGFITRKATARPGGGRTIKELVLHEVSIVAVPSHPGARITQAKSVGAGRTKESEMDDIETKEKETAAAPNLADIEKKMDEIFGKVNELGKLPARIDDIEKKANRPGAIETKDNPNLELKAFTSYLRHGREALPVEEVKSLNVANDTTGGYLAPNEFVAEVVKGIVEISPIRQAARVGNTAMGSVILPKRTGRPTAHWVGETEARPETGSAYGQVEIPTHEMACYVDVSLRLLEDAAVNVESEVAFDLAEEFGRLEAGSFLKGDGAKKPRGVMQYPDVPYTKTGNGSTLGSAPADMLIDAFYAVPSTYRGSATWMMNGKTLAAIRKLKDSVTSVYLWQPAITAGQPETILGRPVVEDPEMPDIGSATEPIIFGDFARSYRIYDRLALSVMRDPYSVATSGLVRFHARRRVGGGMVLAEALRKIRCEV